MRTAQQIYDDNLKKAAIRAEIAEEPEIDDSLSAKEYVNQIRTTQRIAENLKLAREKKKRDGQQKVIIDNNSAEQPSKLGSTSETKRNDNDDVSGTASEPKRVISGTSSESERPERRDSERSEADVERTTTGSKKPRTLE